MKNIDKYAWHIGSDIPSLDEHSETKHMIIADYLKRYVEVYMSNANIERLPLTIIDGFSGGGRYRGFNTTEVVDGSPFLILKSLREAEAKLNFNRKKPRFIDAEYHFIEKLKPHYDFLEHELQCSEFKHLLDNKKVTLYHNTFAAVAQKIITTMQNRRRAMRGIFILDQYAYKDVPFPIIQQLLTTTNSEVILTFNFDSLQGFLSEESTNRKALEKIGLAQHIDWQRLQMFKEANKWQEAIQEQLAHAIYQASGAKHMTLFFVKPLNGWTYWLVHLTRLYRARDVMMDLHWRYANTSKGFEHFLGDGLFRLGFQATTIPGQHTIDFGEKFDFGAEARNRCINRLAEAVPQLIFNCNEGILFQDLVDRIGSLTPASGQEIKSAIQISLDQREIQIITPEGKRPGTARQLKMADTLKYLQKQLFL